jgi:isoleucyl-tRNA synthetase
MPLVGGMFVKHADPALIEELKRRGVLWKAGTMTHSYPHCWRCGTPLLYYARTSWFVRTSSYKDEMLARNARWAGIRRRSARAGSASGSRTTSTGRSRATATGGRRCRFGCATRTPSISTRSAASRIWPSAPVAPSATTSIRTSRNVDEHDVGVREAGCAGTMHRTPEVIDAWFDSGSMPFAQWHYPFEHREALASRYPGDFIAEGLDQTRGWFYSLLAIATGLGDDLPNNQSDRASPYRSVVVNDLVLDAEGRKMSKSRGNVVDPWAVFARHGVDAVRLFLVSSSKVWEPRSFDENIIRQGAGRFLTQLKNIYSGMFAQYANFGWSPSAADPAPADRPLLDAGSCRVSRRWSAPWTRRCSTTTRRSRSARSSSSWTRTSRTGTCASRGKRFYDVDTADNRAAFATLHEVLVVVCRLLAPFAPFVTDWLHRELTGESVHLAAFVRERGTPSDQALEAQMASIRTLATLGRAAREQAGSTCGSRCRVWSASRRR